MAHPKDEKLTIPFVEEVVSFFENVTRSRLTFVFSDGPMSSPCTFCGDTTKQELIITQANGEPDSYPCCFGCREGIRKAAEQ